MMIVLQCMGAYITFKRDTLPDFLIWKMLVESEYVVRLEPGTTNYGGANIGAMTPPTDASMLSFISSTM